MWRHLYCIVLEFAGRWMLHIFMATSIMNGVKVGYLAWTSRNMTSISYDLDIPIAWTNYRVNYEEALHINSLVHTLSVHIVGR